jgi:hypothetical protein
MEPFGILLAMRMPLAKNFKNAQNKGKNGNLFWHERFQAVPKASQWHSEKAVAQRKWHSFAFVTNAFDCGSDEL